VRSLVVDASAAIEFLLRTPLAKALDPLLTEPDSDLHVPALCDVEVVSALRRILRRGLCSESRAEEALQAYLDLPLTRHGHQALLPRCLELRDVLSSYDAVYVALAEGLEVDLVTCDRRLARTADELGRTSLALPASRSNPAPRHIRNSVRPLPFLQCPGFVLHLVGGLLRYRKASCPEVEPHGDETHPFPG
jgi:predicted nucleic acid-binding protein